MTIERICLVCHKPIKKTKRKVKSVCQGHAAGAILESIPSSIVGKNPALRSLRERHLVESVGKVEKRRKR